MSNTTIKVAFAFFVALASQTASSAEHAISAVPKSVPITTFDRTGPGKCVQRSPATAAAPKRPDNSVCWAPLDNTDGPGV